MKTLPESHHVRPQDPICCLGMLYSCGHSVTCMYDERWQEAHRRLHRFDWAPEMFFWSVVWIAIFVWAFTR